MGYSATRLTLFAIISAMEQDLRNLIITFLGPGQTPRDLMGDHIWAKAHERFERDWELDDSNGATLERLLYFTDFPDLVGILNTKRSQLPQPIGQHIREFTPKFERVFPIRNRVAHSRPLDFDDLAAVNAIADDLVRRHANLWVDLESTMARLRQEPSFVLGLEIPTDDSTRTENHNLPTPDFDETGFVGRRQQVADLVKLCLGPFPVISIVGDGGVGKTALALKVAYEILDRPDNPFDAIVWTTSKTTRITAQEIVRIEGAIQDSLGMLTSLASHLAGEASQEPMEEVLNYLNEFRILLILDNLETVIDERVKAFLSRLPSGSKILITSRIGLGAFEYPVKLQPMDESEAVQLLRALAKIRGVETLSGASNKRLTAYCRRMKFNPGWIKWFVSALQTGRRPEEILDKSDMFLDFCMSNVYEHLTAESRKVMRALLAVPGRHSQAELAFLTEMEVLNLQRAIQQLLTTNMVSMTSIPKGSSFESQYDLSDLARAYLLKHHPVSPEEFGYFTRRKQQLVSAGEQMDADRLSNPYSPYSLTVRSPSDRIVAKYLLDALKAAKRGDFAEAERLVDTARGLAPEYFEVHRVEAWVKVAMQNMPAARTAYEAAIELEPDSAPLRFWFGSFLMRYLDDTETALIHFRRAVQLDPQSVDVLLELARAHLYRRDFGETKSILGPLLSRTDLSERNRRKVHDLNLQQYQRLADHLASQRDYVSAVAALQQLKEAYLGCPTVLVDTIMKDKLRRALPTAETCAFYLEDDAVQAKAKQLANWLAEVSDAGGKETPIIQRDREVGTVIKLLLDYGFIRSGDGNELFFHRKDLVRASDWRKLRVGGTVNFVAIENQKGPRAINVVLGEANGSTQ